ncbi:hypothetical protein U1Q18_017714 [Sarracenia purpurea var. burkii]
MNTSRVVLNLSAFNFSVFHPPLILSMNSSTLLLSSSSSSLPLFCLSSSTRISATHTSSPTSFPPLLPAETAISIPPAMSLSFFPTIVVGV